MAFQRLIFCDDCGGSFWHRIERRGDPGPEACPLCAGGAPEPEPFEAKAPAIRGVAGISGDMVYRAMEDSSAVRAEAAAEAMGVDPSETAHMKITNMQDRQRAGDRAVMPMTMTAAAMNDQARALSFGGAPTQYIQMAQSGPEAGHWGELARQQVTGRHAQVAAAVERAGEIGRARK